MKHLIKSIFVLLCFIFLSCSNNKDNIVTVSNNVKNDADVISFTLTMGVWQQSQEGEFSLVNETEYLGIYSCGDWVYFDTYAGDNSSFYTNYSISWSGGSGTNNAGRFEIWYSDINQMVFQQYLVCNSNTQGTISNNCSVNLQPSTSYRLRLCTDVITGEGDK